jgi:hypothetical protein
MASGEIHVNDIGTAFRIVVRDEDNRVVDLGPSTTRTMLFQKPSGDVLKKPASLTGSGSDGRMQYVSASGDLSEPGKWKYQGHVVFPSGSWYTDVIPFRVYPNLE